MTSQESYIWSNVFRLEIHSTVEKWAKRMPHNIVETTIFRGAIVDRGWESLIYTIVVCCCTLNNTRLLWWAFIQQVNINTGCYQLPLSHCNTLKEVSRSSFGTPGFMWLHEQWLTHNTITVAYFRSKLLDSSDLDDSDSGTEARAAKISNSTKDQARPKKSDDSGSESVLDSDDQAPSHRSYSSGENEGGSRPGSALGADKNSKKTKGENRQSRKSKDAALQEIYSESNRMLRESKVRNFFACSHSS